MIRSWLSKSGTWAKSSTFIDFPMTGNVVHDYCLPTRFRRKVTLVCRVKRYDVSRDELSWTFITCGYQHEYYLRCDFCKAKFSPMRARSTRSSKASCFQNVIGHSFDKNAGFSKRHVAPVAWLHFSLVRASSSTTHFVFFYDRPAPRGVPYKVG